MTPSGPNNQSFLLRIAPESLHLQRTMKNDDFLLNYCIYLEMQSPRLLPEANAIRA
jgi:hypothetical protein